MKSVFAVSSMSFFLKLFNGFLRPSVIGYIVPVVENNPPKLKSLFIFTPFFFHIQNPVSQPLPHR